MRGGGAPAAQPPMFATAVTPSDVLQSGDFVVGVVSRVQGTALTVTTAQGNNVRIDIAAIDQDIRRDLRPGDSVKVYAPTRASGLPVASGILVDHSASPAASPR